MNRVNNKPDFEIRKQPGGKMDEKARLEIISLLANAGYTVGQSKIPGKSEYVIRIWNPTGGII